MEHQHYMHREIYEQPQAITATLAGRVTAAGDDVNWYETGLNHDSLAACRHVLFLGSGSALHAGLLGAAMVTRLAGLPAWAEPGSEFRYGQAPLPPATLAVAVSQSGETADTLGALAAARLRGARSVLAVTNVADSKVARAADHSFPTRAGQERSVASTKAYAAQLAALALLAVGLGRARQALTGAAARALLAELQALPGQIEALLRNEQAAAAAGRDTAKRPHAFYIGRQMDWVTACEGQLKLKETSYIHAEAFAAGELRHGPMALVDEQCTVVGIVTDPDLRPILARNLAEIRDRGARIVLVAQTGADGLDTRADHFLSMPAVNPALTPLLAIVPLQLLAYHAAVALGRDVDAPRNLVKSVTTD